MVLKILVNLHCKCDALSSDELGLLAIANIRAVMSAGWEDRNASLVASAHVMAFLLGALEAEGEWVIVDDPIVIALNVAELAFLNNFEINSKLGFPRMCDGCSEYV